MAQKREIAYEPHPVSLERKRELNAQGFRVLDAKFAPSGRGPTGTSPGHDKSAGQDQDTASNPDARPTEQVTESVGDGLDGLDAEQLHLLAKERGVSVHHKSGADKVREALRQAA